MNQKEFISMLARMESKPNDMEWAAFHKIARILTVQAVRDVVDNDPRSMQIEIENQAKEITGISDTQIGVSIYAPLQNRAMLQPVNSARRSDSRQCSQH